jgi:broad specificity phosphatase PhoE
VRHFEVRRHSVRDIPDEHLSAQGRRLAAEFGRGLGPFRLVVASPAARARETADAMGFPADELDPLWNALGDGRVAWPVPFRGMLDEIAVNPRAAEVAVRFQTGARELLGRVRDDEAVLLVAHGGVPELLAAAWCEPAVLDRLGPACRCMEGVRFAFTGDVCTSAEALRVSPERTRM